MANVKRGVSLIMALIQITAVAFFSGCNDGSVDKPTVDKTVKANYDIIVSKPEDTSDESLTEEKVVTTVIPGVEGVEEKAYIKYKLIEGDFCLIKKGEVKCSIVIEAGCDQKIYTAAWDLADNLASMTGAEFPVIEIGDNTPKVEGNKILVGKSRYTKELGVEIPSGYPDNEGFVIISSKNIMVLAGNDESYYNGTSYAVTSFLETLGFGWFASDSLWNVVPSADTIYAPSCNILSRPSFPTRYNRVVSGDANSNPVLAKRWFLGGEPSEVDHRMHAIIPTSVYGMEHEYYALVNGKRSVEGKVWWQVCLSNKGVQEEAIKYVRNFFKKNPEYTGVSIGQNDGNGGVGDVDYGNFCECDNCKEFADGFGMQMIKFANIVARAVKDEYPDKTVLIYAYGGTFNAPTLEQLGEKIESNVLIAMCRQGGMTRRIRNGDNFDESANLTVKKRVGYLHSDGSVQRTAIVKDNFLSFKKLGAQVALYEWNCPGAAGDNEWRNRFWVQGKTFIDNARWLKENGCRFIYIDQGPNGSYESSDFDCFELRWPLWYVSARSMWNVNLSFEDIMMSACKRLYGDAAETMYEFYSTLADANDSCDVFCFEWTLPSGAEMYGAYVKELNAIMSKARKQGNEIGGDIKDRIENQYSYWELTKSHSGLK